MRHSLRQNLRHLRAATAATVREIADHLRWSRDLRKQFHGGSDLKLNIACGRNVEEGWINLDIHPGNSSAFYLNAMNSLPIADGSVRRIHCEHFLEHLEYFDAVRFLRECHRILQPSGTMRIIVPDFEKYILAYARNDTAFFHSLSDLGNPSDPLVTRAMVINQMARMGGDHRFAWDFATLHHVARSVGFSACEKSELDAAPAEFSIDGQDGWRAIESLYAELARGASTRLG